MARQWMPMYWGDYARKTQHLSTLEHGAYLLLIAHYWNTGEALPDSDEMLRRITRTTTKQWNAMQSTIRALFVKDGDNLRHEKIEEVLESSRGVSTLQSSRAKQRWNNEQKQLPLDSAGNAVAMPTTTTTTLRSNKPLSESVAAQGKVVLKNGDFDIMAVLSDAGRAAARRAAPGWDLYPLASIYNEKIRSGQWDKPDKPDLAFAGWVGKYTKGRQP